MWMVAVEGALVMNAEVSAGLGRFYRALLSVPGTGHVVGVYGVWSGVWGTRLSLQ